MQNYYLSRVEILFFGEIPVNMIHRLNWYAVLNVIVVVSYFFQLPMVAVFVPQEKSKSR